MKRISYPILNRLVWTIILALVGFASQASHIVGAELRYKWIGTTPTDQTYRITVVLYGDCGPSSSGAFSTLPATIPNVCIYDGPTLINSTSAGGAGFPTGFASLHIVAPNTGQEVTPVCPDSLAYTQCSVTGSAIPGIKKFVYDTVITLPPYTSSHWRFVYNGFNSGGSSPGRAAAITNITSPGSTTMQLIDTLNNSATNTRGHNSSPVLTVEPTPFFCGGVEDCYNPGAVDLYDTSYVDEPAGDSLHFSLIPPTNGNPGLCSVGGPIGYVSSQCPGGPLCTGAEPLSLVACAPGDFSFDSLNGQLCFVPTTPQRSVVVYNIEEYRNDTISGIVNKVLVGTMQREMTFLVLPCTYTNPVGLIDSFVGLGDTIDGSHYYACANTGDLILNMDPHDGDPSLNISVAATSLPTGFTFAVTGNNTPTPHVTITLNTNTTNPGTYTFYLTYIDDHCPLAGKTTQAFTVQILPVPTLNVSLISPAMCDSEARYMVYPGGTGKPWTVKFWQPGVPVGDTFLVHVDSLPFEVNLAPGILDSAIIYTAISNRCAIKLAIPVDTPRFPISGTFISPDYCGGADGSITVKLLHPGKLDSVRYSRDGITLPKIGFIVPADSTDTITGLLAGTYYVNMLEGYCVSDTLGPLTLLNPPFRMGNVTGTSPTKCGFCNGIDTVFRLHPGQLDTIIYTYIDKPGDPPVLVTQSHFVTSDSLVVLSGLCDGIYSNFVVHTAGYNVCSDSCCLFTLSAPPINDAFDTSIHYGCKADTIFFTNQSSPASELYYHWNFGDGSTSAAVNPVHVYTNTNSNSFTVELDITNTKCVDTFKVPIFLNNYVHAGFTMDPPEFVCQLSPVTFTNTSTGVSPITNAPPSYLWIFGDGMTDNATLSPVHTFTNTNAYTVKLVASNTVPCYDTAVRVLQVDSISVLSINASDSVICRGQAITFTGIYTTIGDTGNTWLFGDANSMVNVNPILHSYDDTGSHTVTLTTLYRACPQQTYSRNVFVIEHPDLYLGPDVSICPGGNPLALVDNRNEGKANTKWLWSTGDTSSAIMVTKPGYYSLMVTKDGCAAYDTVWVQKDCYMDIPNVFTPNGDGTNDYFYPRQLLTKGLVKFQMDIYNRWGQLIFETTSTDGRGWDGSFNDKPQPEGVYVYLIEATYKDGQVEHHQGNVTILR